MSVRSKRIDLFKICFCATIVSNLVIYIAQPLNILFLETVASRIFIISNLVAVLFVFFQNLKGNIKINKAHDIIIIFFMASFSFVSYLFSSGGGIYNYIIRLLCYLALPFYFLYMDYVKPDKKLINFVFIITFITSFVFILLSFTDYRYAGYENFLGTKQAWLTLGYDNPNQTGMYLLLTLIILFCMFRYYKIKSLRIIILFNALFIGKLLIQTASRASILGGIFVLATILFKKRYTISRYTVILILLLPLTFIVVYPILYETVLYQWDLGIFGKEDFSSRVMMIKWVLYSVSGSYFFGNYGINQLQNSHNGTLSVYSSLGLVGLSFFYIYYFKCYFNMLPNEFKRKTSFIAFVGLLTVFIHATAEAAFFVGGSMYAGTLSILIFLTKIDLEGIQDK